MFSFIKRLFATARPEQTQLNNTLVAPELRTIVKVRIRDPKDSGPYIIFPKEFVQELGDRLNCRFKINKGHQVWISFSGGESVKGTKRINDRRRVYNGDLVNGIAELAGVDISTGQSYEVDMIYEKSFCHLYIRKNITIKRYKRSTNYGNNKD